MANQVTCSYSYNTTLLSCTGPTGSIECNSTIDFTQLHDFSYDVVSFGHKIHYYYGVSSTLIKYKIFPFKFLDETDETRYEYKHPIYGYDIASFMTHNSTYLVNSMHDLVCFNQLIGLLNDSHLLKHMLKVVNDIYDTIF